MILLPKKKRQKENPYVCDSSEQGNICRFLNHSCHPNLKTVVAYTNPRDLRFPRIAFFANERIPKGTELRVDYGLKYWKDKGIPCPCEVHKAGSSAAAGRSAAAGSSARKRETTSGPAPRSRSRTKKTETTSGPATRTRSRKKK